MSSDDKFQQYKRRLQTLKDRLVSFCPVCGGNDFSLTLGTQAASGISIGRYNPGDINPLIVLGCDSCSETILILDENDSNILLEEYLRVFYQSFNFSLI